MENMLLIFVCKAILYNEIRQRHTKYNICKQFELKYHSLSYLENEKSKIIFELIYLGNDDYDVCRQGNDAYMNLVKEYCKQVFGNLDVKCLINDSIY
jgi:hypothetical protein